MKRLENYGNETRKIPSYRSPRNELVSPRSFLPKKDDAYFMPKILKGIFVDVTETDSNRLDIKTIVKLR